MSLDQTIIDEYCLHKETLEESIKKMPELKGYVNKYPKQFEDIYECLRCDGYENGCSRYYIKGE